MWRPPGSCSWSFAPRPVIGVATFFQLGLYRLVTRYIGGQGAVLIPVAVGLSALVWSLLVLLSGVQAAGDASRSVVRSVSSSIRSSAAAFVWGTRQAAGWLLKSAASSSPCRVREKAKQRADLRRRHDRRAAARGAAPLRHLRAGRLRRHEPDAVGPVRRRPQGVSPRAHGRASSQRHDVQRGAAGDAQGQAAGAAGGAAAARAADGGRADAAGDRGPCRRPRDGQRSAPGRGGGPAGARSGASQRRRCWPATSRASRCW